MRPVHPPPKKKKQNKKSSSIRKIENENQRRAVRCSISSQRDREAKQRKPEVLRMIGAGQGTGWLRRTATQKNEKCDDNTCNNVAPRPPHPLKALFGESFSPMLSAVGPHPEFYMITRHGDVVSSQTADRRSRPCRQSCLGIERMRGRTGTSSVGSVIPGLRASSTHLPNLQLPPNEGNQERQCKLSRVGNRQPEQPQPSTSHKRNKIHT